MSKLPWHGPLFLVKGLLAERYALALKYVAKHYLVAYAIFVMLLLVFSPGGIIGFFEKRFAAARAAAQAVPAAAKAVP